MVHNLVGTFILSTNEATNKRIGFDGRSHSFIRLVFVDRGGRATSNLDDFLEGSRSVNLTRPENES